MTHVDTQAARSARAYGREELVRRVAWSGIELLYRWSPRLLFEWRCFLLRRMGASIGEHVQVHPDSRIALPWLLTIGDWSAIGDGSIVYNLGPVRLGSHVTVSQRAHLCAGSHDHRRSDMPLLRSGITIGDDAWICAEAFVGPGVTIGEGAVVGARAVVTRDVEPWTIVAGNLARQIGRRSIER